MTTLSLHPNWVDSQSGRKKIDFGPKANFKKQKVKEGGFKGLPKCMEGIIKRIIMEIGGSGVRRDDCGNQIADKVQGFQPVEVNVLEYKEERGSNIAPHFDDTWLWGERIFGINLLSDTVMTFAKDNL